MTQRCRRCHSEVDDVSGFDCITCPRCGSLPAGLFDTDPTYRCDCPQVGRGYAGAVECQKVRGISGHWCSCLCHVAALLLCFFWGACWTDLSGSGSSAANERKGGKVAKPSSMAVSDDASPAAPPAAEGGAILEAGPLEAGPSDGGPNLGGSWDMSRIVVEQEDCGTIAVRDYMERWTISDIDGVLVASFSEPQIGTYRLQGHRSGAAWTLSGSAPGVQIYLIGTVSGAELEATETTAAATTMPAQCTIHRHVNGSLAGRP